MALHRKSNWRWKQVCSSSIRIWTWAWSIRITKAPAAEVRGQLLPLAEANWQAIELFCSQSSLRFSIDYTNKSNLSTVAMLASTDPMTTITQRKSTAAIILTDLTILHTLRTVEALEEAVERGRTQWLDDDEREGGIISQSIFLLLIELNPSSLESINNCTWNHP